MEVAANVQPALQLFTVVPVLLLLVGSSGAPDCVPDGSGSAEGNCSLESVLANVTSHSIIRLDMGNYTLEKFILIRDVVNITLEARGSETAVFIQCKTSLRSSAGLAFVNVSQLRIHNIVMDGCGFTGEDIKRTTTLLSKIMNFFYTVPSSVRIAILFGHCEDVLMDNVVIENTRGFGLVGVNVVGSSKLSNVRFHNNTNPGVCSSSQDVFNPSPGELSQYDSLGGAAAFMYFDYLQGSGVQTRQQTNLTLEKCTFRLNSECSLTYLNLLRSPGQGESNLVTSLGYALGGSGALALALAQLQYGVSVEIVSSIFSENSATFGSGSTVAMFMGIQNTRVMFSGCRFDQSGVVFFNDVRQPQDVERFPDVDDRNVSLSVLNTNFTNGAEITAGSTLLIFSNYYSEAASNSVDVYIEECLFKGNRATVGSALAIYEYKINGFSVGMQVHIKDTDFIDNEVITVDREDMDIAISQSASTVNVVNVNLTLLGSCSFINNIGTGLLAESSVIGVSGNITFLGNIGVNGGALSFVLYSYLIVNRGSSIYFIENKARVGGGAIYVNENGLGSYLVGGYVDCFLHFAYNNFIACANCSDLDSYDVHFKFSDNHAAFTGNLISGSSLITCPWTHKLRENDQFNRTVFEILDQDFPEVFDVDQPSTNSTSFQSVAARLVVKVLNSSDNHIEVFPGQLFKLSVTVLDDFDQIISNVITGFATSDSGSFSVVTPLFGSTNFAVLERGKPTTVSVKILGSENQTISLVIYSTDSAGRAQTRLNITLLSCGFGFIFDPSTMTCACESEFNDRDRGVSCDGESHTITVQTGAWIGPFQDKIIIDRCLFQYCKPGVRDILIDSDNLTDVNFNIQCDRETNRVGFLCSKCREGYSAVLGTRNCRQCSNWYLFLFIFFIVIGVVAVIVIHFLNITITAGYINGAIFYSNIVSIYGYFITPGRTYNKALAIISFPTLNLGIETCLYDGMTALEKVLWQLSFPLYLFILMMIITLLARTKFLKMNQSSGSSAIRVFATLVILCYVSVLGACAELIAFNRIHTTERNIPFILQWRGDPSVPYFGKEHAVPGLIACLILILYILPLPIFLLFPSLLYGNKYLSKFKPIYDAFWDPYKPRYRFFLGLRLMFRWLPFFLVATVRPPTSIFVTQFFLILLLLVQCTVQPFREKWQNYLDSGFVCNLLLLLSGSVFFWSEFRTTDSNAGRTVVTQQSLIYSTILIVLGFLMVLGILIYHVFLRFPKLQEWIKARLFKKNKNHQLEIETQSEYTTVSQDNETHDDRLSNEGVNYGATAESQTHPRTPTVATFSELRESLLDSGSATLYTVNPSLVPPRVQSLLGEL